MTTTLLRKSSPSGEVTLFLAQRDFVDHFIRIDTIDGVVFVPPDVAYGYRLFVEVQLHFRYGAESDEFADVSLKKVARLAHAELFPIGERRSEYAPNKWQNGLFKKFGNVAGACPFSLTLPPGPPPSKIVHGAMGITGEPLGLTYQVVAFLAHEPNDEPQRRNAVRMNIRVIQEQIAENLKEHLAVMPLSRPATMVGRQFLLSTGRIQIEMCLDKAVAYYGDRMTVSVSISNSSNRTVRKIKCKLAQTAQMSFATGERRITICCLESHDGCPIPPGASLQRTYCLTLKLEPHRRKEGMVFDDPIRGYPDQLSASTIFPYTDPKEGFAILVGYIAKIKLCLGAVHGTVSAQVPFLMFQPSANGDVPCKNDVKQPPPRMIRLISLEEAARSENLPLVSF